MVGVLEGVSTLPSVADVQADVQADSCKLSRALHRFIPGWQDQPKLRRASSLLYGSTFFAKIVVLEVFLEFYKIVCAPPRFTHFLQNLHRSKPNDKHNLLYIISAKKMQICFIFPNVNTILPLFVLFGDT